MIYFDNAATTFPKPTAVYDAMDRVNRTSAVNAGRGSYKIAREMTRLIDDTKSKLIDLFFANNADVIFTPSITHAFNQVLWGIALEEGDYVYASAYEHNAVARTLFHLQYVKGIKVEMLPILDDGRIDLEKTKFLFNTHNPKAIVLTALSNVTGYVTPFEKVFKLAKEVNNNCITVVDAAQAAGLIPLNYSSSYLDVLCFAGHKTLYGPFGIAGFLLRKGLDLSVTLTGGTGSDSLNKDMPTVAPAKYEAASPNIVAIAGLNATLSELDVKEHLEVIKNLTNYLLQQLHQIKKIHILGNNEDCLGIVSFVVDGYTSSDVGTILDEEYDISVRTGYHCCPDLHDFLHDKTYGGTIRVGLGMFNTQKDIDILVEALKTL